MVFLSEKSNGCNKEVDSLIGSVMAGSNGIDTSLKLLDLAPLGLHSLA
jgi:hypothetical protein